MAYLKFTCKEGRPCFQHDGGSGYVETGNRLLAFARDERALPPDSNRVDFLSPHARMLEVRFIPALFPQNWTAQVESSGLGVQEQGHLGELRQKLNEAIAARGELQLADFFLYYSAAYDFQVAWTSSDESLLPAVEDEAAAAAQEAWLRLAYRGTAPYFLLRETDERTSDGQVLRLVARPAIRGGKCDSVDIGLYPTYEGSGKLHFAAGVKFNNYGGLPVLALTQAFWSNLINGLNEALPQQREMDLTPTLAFLSAAYAASVFTPPAPAGAGSAPAAAVEAPPPAAPPAPAPPPTPARPSPWYRRIDLHALRPLRPWLLVLLLIALVRLILWLGDLFAPPKQAIDWIMALTMRLF